MIKNILFDMDGVLIDAKEWHYDALNLALDIFGYKISRVDHIDTYDGLPTQKKLEMLSKEKMLPSGLHEFINSIKQIYTMGFAHNYCRPIFHHLYALSRLKEDGYRMAVCTNSIANTIDVMLKYADLNQYIDFFLSADDVVNPKPDPEIYVKAIERLGSVPEECLIVEDNENGIKAAVKSGAHVLKVVDVEEVNYKNIITAIAEINEVNPETYVDNVRINEANT